MQKNFLLDLRFSVYWINVRDPLLFLGWYVVLYLLQKILFIPGVVWA